MLLLGQNAVLVVKKTLQNFYQCSVLNKWTLIQPSFFPMTNSLRKPQDNLFDWKLQKNYFDIIFEFKFYLISLIIHNLDSGLRCHKLTDEVKQTYEPAKFVPILFVLLYILFFCVVNIVQPWVWHFAIIVSLKDPMKIRPVASNRFAIKEKKKYRFT